MYMVQFVGYTELDAAPCESLEEAAAVALQIPVHFRSSIMDCIVWARTAAAEIHNKEIQPIAKGDLRPWEWEKGCQAKDVTFDQAIIYGQIIKAMLGQKILGWMLIRQVTLEIIS